MKITCFLLAAVAGLGLAVSAHVTQAGSYPDGPVTVVVPFNAGGGTDRQARMIEEEFKAEFGQSLVFVYRPGASGAIGATAVSKAKPDGYTIGVYTYPLMVMNALTGKGQYGIGDFDYLAVASTDDVVLVTRKESPYGSLEALVADAKAKPGKLSIGTVESLGPTHMAALDFKDLGIDVNIVPLPGGAKGMAAVLGGHVDALFALRGATRGSASKLTYLGITRAERHKDAPDLPTFKEKGFEVLSGAARIWIAPDGLDKGIHDRLVAGLEKIYAREDVRAKQKKAGQIVDFHDGKALRAKVDTFVPKAEALLKKHGGK